MAKKRDDDQTHIGGDAEVASDGGEPADPNDEAVTDAEGARSAREAHLAGTENDELAEDEDEDGDSE